MKTSNDVAPQAQFEMVPIGGGFLYHGKGYIRIEGQTNGENAVCLSDGTLHLMDWGTEVLYKPNATVVW